MATAAHQAQFLRLAADRKRHSGPAHQLNLHAGPLAIHTPRLGAGACLAAALDTRGSLQPVRWPPGQDACAALPAGRGQLCPDGRRRLEWHGMPQGEHIQWHDLTISLLLSGYTRPPSGSKPRSRNSVVSQPSAAYLSTCVVVWSSPTSTWLPTAPWMLRGWRATSASSAPWTRGAPATATIKSLSAPIATRVTDVAAMLAAVRAIHAGGALLAAGAGCGAATAAVLLATDVLVG